MQVNGPTGSRTDTQGISLFNNNVDYRIAFDSVGNTVGYIRYNVDTANSAFHGHIFSAGDYNGTPSNLMFIRADGNVSINNLAGSGNRLVSADTGGTLGSVTIGTGLSLSGGVLTATGGGSGTIGGSGTSGTMPVFTGTSSIGNSIVTASASLITVTSNTDGQIIQMARSGGAYLWKLGITSGSLFAIYNNGNTSMLELDPNSANMTLGSGQNVTIRLGRNSGDWGEVQYSGGVTTLRNGWDNTSAYVQQLVNGQSTRLYGSGILDQNRTSEGTFYRLLTNGNGRMTLGTDGSGNAQIRTGNNVDLRLGVNEDAIIIKNGGNVGIGTASPNARLHVINSGAVWNGVFGGFWGAGGVALGVQSGNTPSIQGFADITQTNLGAFTNLSLNPSGGNVLIGTTTDVGSTLHVNGTIRTGAPSGGSAVNWRLGTARGGTVTTNATVRVEIDGVLVDLVARYV